MKKLFSIFMLVLITFSTCLITTGCSSVDTKTIRVNQVTNSIFYAPLYVAINNGYFEDEGYKIELNTAEGSNTTNVALMTNSADIGLMGPEQNVYSYVNGDENYPVVFGQLTKRDGSFLISRTNETDFDWSNLAGKHIIAGRKGGSPAMSLQYALELNGYDVETDLNFDTSIAFASIGGTFMSGVGDYMTMFEPAASEFVKSGGGYIVASVGEESGEIPFTCFSANKDYIEKNPEVIIAFLKAIQRGLNYIKTATIDDVVDSLAPSFSGSSKESIKVGIQNYIKADAWNSSPVMTQASFNRLVDMLTHAGELSKTAVADYDKIINNNFGEFVMKQYFAK
ncbi:MAG: ABC transporter substrate-binding protein [Christensenellales bacterium]